MTDTAAEIEELNRLADRFNQQLDDLARLCVRLQAEQAELRDELHTLANRHGWSVKV